MTERRPGVWRLRVVTGYRRDGTPVQRSRTVRGSKRQAQTELARFVAEVGASDHRDPELTFEAFVERHYLPHLRERSSPETVRSRTGQLRLISHLLGPVKLSRVTAYDLDLVYRQLAKTRQASTVRAFHRGLSAAFSQAVRWRMLKENPALLAAPPSVSRREPTQPTIAQIGQLIHAARDPVLTAAITLGALTGLRRGELCGLRWEDIDAPAMVLHVRRAVKRGLDGQLVVGLPKGGRERELTLDPATLEVLSAHRRRAEAWAAATGTTPQGYVLSRSPDGSHPLKPTSLTEQFHTVAKKVGCPQVRLHDLRHAVATNLLGHGYDVATVAGRLGHATPQVTLTVYAHVLAERDRQAAGVMSGLLGFGAGDEGGVVDHQPTPYIDAAGERAGARHLVDGLGRDTQTPG